MDWDYDDHSSDGDDGSRGWMPRSPFGQRTDGAQQQSPPGNGDPGPAPYAAHHGIATPAPATAQPWQDHSGQWHYPYEAVQQQDAAYASSPAVHAQYAVAAAHDYAVDHMVERVTEPQEAGPDERRPEPRHSTIVAQHELEQLAPPQHARPAPRVRDPQRTALAGVITFISAVIALWAVLGFVHSMAETLSSVSSGNDKLQAQLTEANKGLSQLAEKTGSVKSMQTDAKTLRTQLETIDKDMGAMLTGVGTIGDEMQAMDSSLTTLDAELATVNGINKDMAGELGSINAGLARQAEQVTAMRKDVAGTGAALKQLSPRLTAVNSRLGHINSVVCYMGVNGVFNNLRVTVKVFGLKQGTAEIKATVLPKGSWRC